MQTLYSPQALDDLVQGMPETRTQVHQAAQALYNAGDTHEAIDLLTRALSKHPDPALRIALGDLYLKGQRYAAALMHLVDGLRSNPHDASTILLVCESLIGCGEFNRAKAMLKRARQAGASSNRVSELRQHLEQRQNQSPGMALLDDSHSSLSMSPLSTFSGPQHLAMSMNFGLEHSSAAEEDTHSDLVALPPQYEDEVETIIESVDDFVARVKPTPKAPASDAIAFPVAPKGVTPPAQDDEPTRAFERARVPTASVPAQEGKPIRGGFRQPDAIAFETQPMVIEKHAPLFTRTQKPKTPEQAPLPPSKAPLPPKPPTLAGSQPVEPAEATTITDGATIGPKKSSKGIRNAIIVLSIPLLLLGASWGIAYAADRSVAKEVEAYINAAEASQKLDTYQGDISALKSYKQASTVQSFLRPKVDTFIQTQLPNLPGLRANTLKSKAQTAASFLSARLEYDHEQAWPRKSGTTLNLPARARFYHDLLRTPSTLDASNLQSDEALELMVRLGQTARVEASSKEASTPRARRARARALRALGQEQEAVEIYSDLLKQNNDLVEALIGANNSAWSQDKVQSSINRLTTALSDRDATLSTTQRIRLHMALVQLYHQAEQPTRALTHAKSAKAAALVRPDLLTPLIRRAIYASNAPEAKAMIDAWVDAKLNVDAAYLLSSELAIMQGDTAEAIKQATRAASMYPDRGLLLGLAYLEENKPQQALKSFEEALKQDAPRTDLNALKVLAQRMASPTNHSEAVHKQVEQWAQHSTLSPLASYAIARTLFLDARSSKTTKDSKPLIEQARAVMQRVPIDLSGRIMRLRCELDRHIKDLKAAKESCAQALQQQPTRVDNILAFAHTHMDSGHPELAKSLVRPAINAHTTNPSLRHLLIAASIRQGLFQEAFKDFEQWQNSQAPKTKEFERVEALLNFQRGRYALASTQAEQFIQSAPDDVEIQLMLAYANMRHEKLEGVEDVFKAHLKDASFGGYAWLGLGELRRKQDKFKDAEQNLSRARRMLKKQDAPSWMKVEASIQRALAWQQKHGWSHTKIKKHLDQAQRDASGVMPELSYLLGLYELNQAPPEYAAAKAHFDATLEVNPAHCLTLKSLAYINTQQNKSVDKDVRKRIKTHCPKGTP